MNSLPTVVIGAGPIGLAAAAHLYERNEEFLVLEKGASVGSNILEWGHVQLFSPWGFNINSAAKELLHNTGWVEPEADKLPTGKEIVEEYLEPLAKLPQFAGKIRYQTKVTAVTRKNKDKMKSSSRENTPFVIYAKSNGKTKKIEAKAIIDASGTWNNSNPPFADGVWRDEKIKERVITTIPNIKAEEERFKNKHIAVIGSGHSALNTLIDLAELKESYPETKISWIVRKQQVQEAFGGEDSDALAARGALGTKTHKIIDNGVVNVFSGFYVEDIVEGENGIDILSTEGMEVRNVDEVIVNTGARPNFTFLSELRLDVDPAIESTPKLAPLIDPNLHSCGTVRPHGEGELRHPEQNFYIAGVKSYGRAPTFLMTTGYEQVRSIVAYISGDLEAAKKVELKLPETGVCKVNPAPKQLQIVGVNTGCGDAGCGC
ncbi:NAD(P)-binding domain-containing protein [Ornithinibacillus californiensis]|uniref:NAD(P)-binding domain-containing protein n=1 Tax=Ornithinibacillus californiensis TaxID=161536 RepID=UPI00064D85D1|nr:NAD(P)-binding domain-containing protein [Ornithinibacillus californiensis]